ncbi:hypothetical protein R5R35_012978 [Gryllus longicercus]|uniref:Uncharacterized protein n=1 Tax=Gryllus longicercus TaxID=2509291 RepID=A0AAN9WUQ1_9ORTH
MRTVRVADLDDSECEEVAPSQVRVHDSTAQTPQLRRMRNGSWDEGRRRSSGTSGMIKVSGETVYTD